MKRIRCLILMTYLATPALASDGEAFFQSIEKYSIAPGSRLEVINCKDVANGGITCSIKIINETGNPEGPAEEPLTIW